MLVHIRANRRQTVVNVTRYAVRNGGFSRYNGGEWEGYTSHYYRGTTPYAPIAERIRSRDNWIQWRPVGSPRNSWQTSLIRWDENGWYFS